MKRIAIIANSKTIDTNLVRLYLKEAYDVKVSTDDIKDNNRYVHLMTLPNSDHLHIQELDFSNPKAIKEFIKDCDYVVFSNALVHLFLES